MRKNVDILFHVLSYSIFKRKIRQGKRQDNIFKTFFFTLLHKNQIKDNAYNLSPIYLIVEKKIETYLSLHQTLKVNFVILKSKISCQLIKTKRPVNGRVRLYLIIILKNSFFILFFRIGNTLFEQKKTRLALKFSKNSFQEIIPKARCFQITPLMSIPLILLLF